MGMLERLRRSRSPRAKGPGAARRGPGVEVQTFEYVRVGRTALTRAAGVWAPGAPRLADFTLEVSVLGDTSEAVRALVEPAAPGRNGEPERETWRAAFPTRLEVVEHPAAEFTLLAGDGRIALDPPLLRELPAPEADERQEALESRVREAEAGLGWIQGQLARERERRRELEEEIEAVRAERDSMRPDRERAEGLARQVAELEERLVERDEVVADRERQVAELIGEREQLKEDAAEGPLAAAERARLRELEEKAKQLGRSLEESQQALAAAEDRYREARQELNRVRAGSEAMTAKLGAALEAARGLGAAAQPAPEPATGATACPECQASGECAVCEGKGKRRGKRCTGCGGTGRCATCDGTGYLWEEEAGG